MNKPATKEPSMDEILSSIRQIIADDDATAAPAKPAAMPTPMPPPRPAPVAPAAAAPARPASEPLALSPSQIVSTPPSPAIPEDLGAMLGQLDEPSESDSVDAQLIDPEDVAFDVEPEDPVVNFAPPPPMEAPPPPRPAMAVSRAAPMPDPTLSQDMAEKLLAPATDAAVQSAMARLGSAADTGMRGITVEAMMRDMLRPMLKEWLDENLPALVESMVEREIARISRGVK